MKAWAIKRPDGSYIVDTLSSDLESPLTELWVAAEKAEDRDESWMILRGYRAIRVEITEVEK